MERKRSVLTTSTAMAVPLLAFGLMTMAGGCGSSDNNSPKKDTAVDGPASGNNPEVNRPEVLDVLPQSEVQPIELDAQIDSRNVPGIDARPGVDLAEDKPLPPSDAPGVETSPLGGEVGDAIPSGQGTGGAGGSTGLGGVGGSTEIGANGGTIGAGGAGGSGTTPPTVVLEGWPATTLDAPHVFAAASCSGSVPSAPAAYTFTLKNNGASAVTVTGVSLSGTQGYAIDLPAGASSVGAGESKTVTITAPALPFPVVPGAAYPSVLTLTTDEPTDNIHNIYLNQVAHGAVLTWGEGATPSYLGGGSPGTPISQDFVVVNTGDEPATIDFKSTDPNFTFLAAGLPASTGVLVPAGGRVTRTLSITAPSTQGTYTTDISMVVSGANNLCKALPAKWSATAMSLAGYPSMVPGGGTLSFTGACGVNTTEDKPITITNVGTANLGWKAAITGTPSCFSIKSPADTSTFRNLSVGAQEVLTITRNAVNAGETADCVNELKVTFQTEGNPEFDVKYALDLVPIGAKLTFSAGPLAFDSRILTAPAMSQTPQSSFTITNSGRTVSGSALTSNVTVNLTLPENSPFAFDAAGQNKTSAVPVPATNAGIAVPVYYVRPVLGPYNGGTLDTNTITWSLGAQDKSCMCGSPQHSGPAATRNASQNYHAPASCTVAATQGNAIGLNGRTTEAALVHDSWARSTPPLALYSAVPQPIQEATASRTKAMAPSR